MSTGDFEPNSINTMLGRILERIDNADVSAADYRLEMRQAMEGLRKELTPIVTDVNELKTWRRESAARVSVLVLFGSALTNCAAWIVEHLWSKK